MTVSVQDNAGGKKVSAHRFIADCFLPPEAGKPNVIHINGKLSDNRVLNLARAEQTVYRGETNGNSKLTKDQVIEIKARLSTGESCMNIAKAFGVHHVHIGRIANGKRWQHIEVEEASEK